MSIIVETINRIEADLNLLRQLTSNASAPVKIPTIKDHYSVLAAKIAKVKIEEAFEAGLVTWDKKRGMKMLVTKRTEGWSRRK